MTLKFDETVPGRCLAKLDEKPDNCYGFTYFWNGRHVWINMHGNVRDYATDWIIGNLSDEKFLTGWKEYWRVRAFRGFLTRLIIAGSVVLFTLIAAIVFNYGK